VCALTFVLSFILRADVVANISEVAFHARSIGTTGGGLVVVPTQRLVLIALYSDATLPVDVVPVAERCVTALIELTRTLL